MAIDIGFLEEDLKQSDRAACAPHLRQNGLSEEKFRFCRGCPLRAPEESSCTLRFAGYGGGIQTARASLEFLLEVFRRYDDLREMVNRELSTLGIEAEGPTLEVQQLFARYRELGYDTAADFVDHLYEWVELDTTGKGDRERESLGMVDAIGSLIAESLGAKQIVPAGPVLPENPRKDPLGGGLMNAWIFRGKKPWTQEEAARALSDLDELLFLARFLKEHSEGIPEQAGFATFEDLWGPLAERLRITAETGIRSMVYYFGM